MKTLTDIQKTLATHRQLLYEKYPIQSMAIFGSYARKEQNDQSDLDLMVEFSGKSIRPNLCLNETEYCSLRTCMMLHKNQALY
ncbi:nucleotidyltransferase family protein [Geofilum rubicundum]|uniref:nucleotidyltransferase family protein n=1 Tax=Geofilum rubicundum TaxID=472113 RepID=UPI000781C88F